MHRFFVQKDQLPYIVGEDVHHVRNVLRLQPGEKIELLDGQGKIYLVKIDTIHKEKITCKILAETESAAILKVKITLAQCLPKAKKMDWIIQKSSELGVWSIIPVISERTIAKGSKSERWQTIAKEAAQQCGLPFIPEIQPAQPFKTLLQSVKNYPLALLPWELEQSTSLKSILQATNLPIQQPSNSTIQQFNNFLILIGPEGGFSATEVNQAKEAGFRPVSLGPRILRTETAGIAMLSMLNYEFNQ